MAANYSKKTQEPSVVFVMRTHIGFQLLCQDTGWVCNVTHEAAVRLGHWPLPVSAGHPEMRLTTYRAWQAQGDTYTIFSIVAGCMCWKPQTKSNMGHAIGMNLKLTRAHPVIEAASCGALCDPAILSNISHTCACPRPCICTAEDDKWTVAVKHSVQK